MAFERRSFAGAAVGATTTGAIDGSTLTINISDATGWPTGSAGDFFAVIDRGTASEEKVRIDTRTSLTLTAISGGRGVDGTAAVSHTSGATIEICLTAVDLDEANAHLSDTTLDHHTQYLNTTRHDIEGRHTFGSALGTPAAPADIGTTAATGSGDNPAREDHVHEIGTGAIDTAAMFAAGVVDAAAIAADAVSTVKILDANVTTAKIADENMTAAKMATTMGRLFTVADTTALEALSSLREGDAAYQQDADELYLYNGTAWALALDYGEWTSYNPSLAWSGGSGSIGNGTLTGVYRKIGRTVHFEAILTYGSTTVSGSGRLRIGLPATSAARRGANGGWAADDISTQGYGGSIAIPASVAYAEMVVSAGGYVTGSTPFTFASTDYIIVGGTYEAAA